MLRYWVGRLIIKKDNKGKCRWYYHFHIWQLVPDILKFGLKPNLDSETILLRNTIDVRRQLKEYGNTIKTDTYRNNLKPINKCFIKHSPDLRIMDTEVSTLSNLKEKERDKEPIDLSSSTLIRIFSNGSFKHGGRFYRGCLTAGVG